MRFPFFCAPLLLLLFSSVVFAAETGAEKTKIAGQVREIFEAKCLDCHGPELPRPKGKFGYVLDLKRVADNPDYVERGHPEKSDLYKMVRDDEMPGEDANVPPLTKDEKEIVKKWIDLGAPEAPAMAGTERAPAVSVGAAEVRPKMALPKRVVRWVGHFHPLSTHFPIGMMFVAVFAEALAWWMRRDVLLNTVRFLVIVGAAGAVAAAALGWANAYFASYTGQLHDVLTWHRWLGTTSAAWAVICAALLLGDVAEGSRGRQRFRGALLFGAALMGISGFLGSALIYGLDHYAWQ